MKLLKKMAVTEGRLLLLAAVLALVLLGLAPQRASAQQRTGWECREVERTGRVTTLDCQPGYATGHDRVVVYGQLPPDWGGSGSVVTRVPDIANGALVFDASADGTANIVITFSQRAAGALVAELYDDQSGDGEVSATVAPEGEFTVTETGPVVQVTAPDGWWQRDGTVNFNLDIVVDGYIRATFGSVFEEYHRTDGTPEVYAHIRDTDRDGRPDLEWRQLYLPFPESWGYRRTEVVVNTEDDEPPIRGALLWPYLGDTYSDWSQYAKLSYSSSTPPIDVDWMAGKLTHVAEFVGSRTEPANYFIYSPSRLREGEVSVADFEAPFAYYDLSGGTDPFPTLMIRDVNFGAGDPYMLGGLVPYLVHDIGYVWRYPASRGEFAPIWDFKVNLVGTNDYASLVEVGDLKILTGNYADLPYLVTENGWDLTTFVADEGGRVANSEGIGAWGAILEHLAPESYQYVAGLLDELPLDYFETIRPGYRGEVAPHFGQQARLYMGAVDGKLHLLRADRGIWSIDDDASELRYANLDQDPYLDQWQYLEDGQVRRQLNWTPGYLVYAGDGRVLITRASIAPALFETLPPRNRDEWLELGQQLETHRLDLEPGDLEAMAAQFEGPASRIEGAALRDFRPDGSGFRFVLALSPGYQVDGTIGPDLEGLAPGDYLVAYHDTFSIRPLTPALVELVPGSLAFTPATPLALQPMEVRLKLHNAGLADLPELAVQLYAGLPGLDPQLVAGEVVSLPGGDTVPLAISWTPPRAGDWRLDFAWDEDPEAVPGAGDSQAAVELQVAAQPPLAVGQIWQISNVGHPLPLLALLGALGLLAAALGIVLLRPVGGRR
jgi:hypothetical protein